MAEAETTRATHTLCLGEALVDMICEHPASGPADATAFVPHCGGSVANVAVFAARAGARTSLAGGAGADEWGDWLHEQLDREGIELSLFGRLDGAQTSLALVTIDEGGEAHYSIYGDSILRATTALGDALEIAVLDSAALFFSSNTLVGADERAATMRARELALEYDRPVVFDPNFRLGRWSSRADAQASANACVPGAFLVRANQAEAALMTGEEDPERAASALLKAGARLVVLTLGVEGAILRGEMRGEVRAAPAHVVSTIGAGDAFTGTLLARLALSDFYPPAVAAALPEAALQASAACERWGAID
ncbi:MAG: PfkB family carbohydrate kinase [Solirubrobacteraceae bacterium]